MKATMRRLVAAAALAGVAGGSVAAVAVPSGTKPPPDPRVAPARASSIPGTVELRFVPGTLRTELRRDDPGGGVGWGIRSFVAARPGHSAHAWLYCQQAGRLFKGRFGWIDGSNVFRPAGPDPYGQAPTLCERSAPGPHKPVQIDARTLVLGIDSPAPRLGTTIAWGVGGTGTRRVDLRVAGHRTRQSLSGRGAFLAFLPHPVRRSEVSATFTYAGGVTSDVPLQPDYQLPRGIGARPGPGNGPVRLVARAPDPAGGLPYGLAGVKSRDGGWCFSQPERVVGDSVGHVDFALGTIVDSFTPLSECLRADDPLFRHHPVAAGFLLGGGIVEDEGDATRRARIVRRTLPGTTIVSGLARADVRSITIATPRDVRTLVPTSPAHAFIAVYDGSFPTGKIVTTAHFADGSSRVVDSFDVGGI
jgi:hypothetical protein